MISIREATIEDRGLLVNLIESLALHEKLRDRCTVTKELVLDWNESAIEFYKSLGAVPMNEWTVFRLDESAMNPLSRDS